MSWFHKHQWTVVSERYNPPPTGLTRIRGDYGFMLALAYGVTTVTQRCADCGRTAVTQVNGKTGGVA